MTTMESQPPNPLIEDERVFTLVEMMNSSTKRASGQ